MEVIVQEVQNKRRVKDAVECEETLEVDKGHPIPNIAARPLKESTCNATTDFGTQRVH